LPNLSPALQVEVLMYVHAHWLDSIWFIKPLDPPVKVRLAMAMEQKVLAPGEVAPQRQLYVISRGTVMFGGRILSRGMAWGDDILLTNAKLFLPYMARAITYVDVTALSADKLMDVVCSYPVSQKALRKHVLHLALRRQIVVEAREKMQAQQKQKEGFFQKVNDAAASLMTDEQEKSMNIALELNKQVQHSVGGMVGGMQAGSAADASLLSELHSMVNEMRVDMRAMQGEMHEIKHGQEKLSTRLEGLVVSQRPALVSGSRLPSKP